MLCYPWGRTPSEPREGRTIFEETRTRCWCLTCFYCNARDTCDPPRLFRASRLWMSSFLMYCVQEKKIQVNVTYIVTDATSEEDLK